MVEELTFGKDSSKFVIKQNIHLDALIEGELIEREYEIILYNAVVPISHFPELGFYSWIKDKSHVGIAGLIPEFPKVASETKDVLEVLIGGGGGAAIGSLIGDLPGAIGGAILGGLLAKEVPEVYNRFLNEYQKRYGIKKVEVIKGTNLRSKSLGLIPIDDRITLFFGLYHYTNRFTSPEDMELNIQAISQITRLIERERTKIQVQIEELYGKNKSREIDEDNPYFEEFVKLDDLLGFYRDFLSVFSPNKDLIYLHNKIEIDSDYRKTTKSRIKRNLDVGDISVKVRKGYKQSEDEIAEQVKKALYKKDYFLESALTIDLEEIITKKKIDIKHGHKEEKELKPFIPFYILDKINRVRIYGGLDINIQSLDITEGKYFDAKEKIMHQI